MEIQYMTDGLLYTWFAIRWNT